MMMRRGRCSLPDRALAKPWKLREDPSSPCRMSSGSASSSAPLPGHVIAMYLSGTTPLDAACIKPPARRFAHDCLRTGSPPDSAASPVASLLAVIWEAAAVARATCRPRA